MISLAGGLPHPGLFPITSVSFTAFPPTASLDSRSPLTAPSDQISATLSTGVGPAPLEQFLQYNGGFGTPDFIEWIKQWTATIHRPAYADWEVLIHAGNTEAWKKVVDLLCDEGDSVLVEEYTFSTSQAVWAPMGVNGVPVKLDSDGMRADDLETVLSTWEEKRPGEKKPKLMYIVPIGQVSARLLRCFSPLA